MKFNPQKLNLPGHRKASGPQNHTVQTTFGTRKLDWKHKKTCGLQEIEKLGSR